MVRVYGTAYVIVRVFLIVASSIVAAKTALSANHASTLLDWTPILAILIAIFTALDTWMKPQQKWQGFMRDRDDLEDLLSQLEEVELGSGQNETIRKEFKSLRQRHRENNVF
jgi:hypothetical protein